MTASADEPTGAMLPDGILVDETAAYFGHTRSSAVIDRLNEADRLNALGEFFSVTADLILTSDFDTDAISARLGCEGGEIYYLLSGPFGLLSLSDPLRLYLGLENTTGETRPRPNISDEEFAILDSFNDPFHLLRMFAIGHTCGGLQELDLYLANFEEWLIDVEGSRMRLMALAQQIEQVLESSRLHGEASSLSVLSGGVQVRATIPQPTQTPEAAAAEAAAAEAAAAEAAAAEAAQAAQGPPVVASEDGMPTGEPLQAGEAAHQHQVQPQSNHPDPVAAAFHDPSQSMPMGGVAPHQPATGVIPQPHTEQPGIHQQPVQQPHHGHAAQPQPAPAAQIQPGAHATNDAFSAAFQAEPGSAPHHGQQPTANPATGTSIQQDSSSSQFADAFIQAAGGAQQGLGTPTSNPPPAAAPNMPSFGVLSTEPHASEGPASQGSGQPASFGTPPAVVPVRQPLRGSASGKVRGASVHGVRHVIQTGVHCFSCGIGVEHHWRHCPICAHRLI